jgi:DUF1680 family protein
MKIAYLLLALVFALPAAAASIEPIAAKVTPRVPDSLEVLSPAAVHIDGWIGARIDANAQQRLLTVDTEPLLAGYSHRPGNHPWIGEHVGKWMHAAALAWAYTGDPYLRTKLDRVAAELVRCQEADGYLGTYLPGKRFGLYPGNDWDVWSHKYNLIGLLTYYQYTGDRAALQACRRMGDLLIATFPEKKSILSAGTHMGMAATSVLEPIVLLYRATGDKRYLDFAQYTVRSWDEPGGPKVLATLLTKKQVNKTANGKAYEMLSNLVGLCELYRATGDKRLLEAVRNAWQDILANRLYFTGSASSFEHFHGDHELPNGEKANICETCVTVTWMQLNLQLLRLTGEAKYGDEFERSLYNHLAAAQHPRGDDWCYYTPLEGRKRYDKQITCCHSSGPRGMALAPQAAYFRGHDTDRDWAFVNTLETSRGTLGLGGQRVVIDQASEFPRRGHSQLTVRTANGASFGMKILLPDWAVPAEVVSEGKKSKADSAGWITLPMRSWKNGDQVSIDFHLGARLIAGDHGNAGRTALTWGPFVLAYDQDRNGGVPPDDSLAFVDKKPSLTPRPGRELAFIVRVAADKNAPPAARVFVPFADAGAGGGQYRVWLRDATAKVGKSKTETNLHSILAVPIQQVTIDDAFWTPKRDVWQNVTIPDCFTKFENDRGGAINNFDRVREGKTGGHAGPPWYDGLIYEMIRGAADFLAAHRDAKLESRIDGYIARIAAAAAKDPDGYLNTWTQLMEPRHRWGLGDGNDVEQHDVYNFGAMVEAGVHYYRATGKADLLRVALKMANHACDTIGPPPKVNVIPGHALPEEALVDLYRLLREKPELKRAIPFPVDEERYLKLAEFWIENRGNHAGRRDFGSYDQDQKPVFQQQSLEGHAVRATLMATGLTALAGVNGSQAYRDTACRLWDNMTNRRMHINGGVGASREGEAFAGDYILPNNGYLETCAAIGSGFFSRNMNLLCGDARYVDELERTLYNAVLAGVSLHGDTYFYENPLEAGKSRSRWSWHGCPCCPPMFLKIMGAMPGYIYAQDDSGIYVNLFVGSRAEVQLPAGKVTLRQTTQYPWQGDVKITIQPEKPAEFDLYVRVPGWCQGSSSPNDLYKIDGRPASGAARLTVNGETIEHVEMVRGYARLQRRWKSGDTVELTMDMPVRLVRANPKVEADRGRVALMRGPIVYCAEGIDNGGTVSLMLPPQAKFTTEYREGLLGGVVVIRGPAVADHRAKGRDERLEEVELVAVPYYANCNRGPSEMQVWQKELAMLQTSELPPTDTVITVQADQTLHPLSRYLTGACIEDVNHEIYGGIYSQMVLGESFQEPPLRDSAERFKVSGMWRPIRSGDAEGTFAIETTHPFVGRQSQRLTFTKGEGRIGVENRGLNRWGMNFVDGKPYEGVIWARSDAPTELFAALENNDGSQSLAETRLAVKPGEWQRLTFTLTPKSSEKSGRLAISLKSPGSVTLGYAFLQPGEWGRFKGLPVRRDVAEGLVSQGITVLRYGGSMVNNGEYRWKKMIGPRDKRQPYHGHWYPYSSNGWGILDFMDFCEAAGFEYVPDFNADETPGDMADFIEYADGPAESQWGRRRTADGHPAPYRLKYLEIGNEERVDDAYYQKFAALAPAIWAKDANVILVVGDFQYSRTITDPMHFSGAASGITSLAAHQKILKLAKQHNREVWFDVHVNTEGPTPDSTLAGTRSFIDALDKIADGARHKVVVFELNANNHSQRRALANAIAINALARDGRLPIVTSANCLQPDGQNDNGWNQGLLFLNPSQVWLQPPGYVTQMYSRNYLPSVVHAQVNGGDHSLDVTATASEGAKALVLRVVNPTEKAEPAQIHLTGFEPRKPQAQVTELSGPLRTVNTAAQPNRIVPQSHPEGNASYTFPPFSVTVIRFE